MREPQSETLFTLILRSIMEGELCIESHRQSLARHSKFEPYAAFCRIDRSASEMIDPYKMLKFLQENGGVGIGVVDCVKLIRFFDSDNDGCLNFHDF